LQYHICIKGKCSIKLKWLGCGRKKAKGKNPLPALRIKKGPKEN
jgi:hypothetical protein